MMHPGNPNLDSGCQLWKLTNMARTVITVLLWPYNLQGNVSQSEHLCSWLAAFKPAVACLCRAPRHPKMRVRKKMHSCALTKVCANPGQSSQYRGSWPRRSRSVQREASLDPPYPAAKVLCRLQRQWKMKLEALTAGWYSPAVWKNSSFCEALAPALGDQHEWLQWCPKPKNLAPLWSNIQGNSLCWFLSLVWWVAVEREVQSSNNI